MTTMPSHVPRIRPSAARFPVLRKFTRAVILTAALAGMTTEATAGLVGCTLRVQGVSVNPAGQLTVAFEHLGFLYMCNVNSNFPTSIGAVSAETCKTWTAYFLTAKATAKPVTMTFDYGGAPTPANCAAITGMSWSTPNPFPYWVYFE